ncbi:MAG TPA: acetylglutamate kinase [Candidatus Eisenbacteria bacterium]|nr:acetylglutamate kinase [Candidatus Eisenbacteria bacterium]
MVTRPAPLVVKLGGRALEAPGAPAELALDLSTLVPEQPVVLVHGGGAEATRWGERLGVPSRFHDGLRVTDPATLEIVVAVLAGLANKRLVAALRAGGVNAVGLSAADGVADIEPHAEAATLGEVGRVSQVDTAFLNELLAQGRLPVLASVGAHRGKLLNINADDLAAGVAGALGASLLVLLSDTPGLRLRAQLVERVDADSIETLLAHPDVTGGMRPKLAAAAAAVRGGAAQAVIAAWDGPGTLAGLKAGAPGGTFVEKAATLATGGARD